MGGYGPYGCKEIQLSKLVCTHTELGWTPNPITDVLMRWRHRDTETQTHREGKELKLRVRPQAGGRTAAWARRSHSLLSGHEYGSARIAALRRHSADLPESYDIISIYKCRNKGIQ